jgi:hypothetical protein
MRRSSRFARPPVRHEGFCGSRSYQGTGTALLRAHHATLDAAGTPAYLEASSDRNRVFYLRHGYADLGPPISLPGGPPMRPALRAAGPEGGDRRRWFSPTRRSRVRTGRGRRLL